MTRTRTSLACLVLPLVGFTNGALRQLGYGRFFSENAATGIVTIAIVVYLLTPAWVLSSPRQASRTGAVWLALTFLFETGMGLAAGRTRPCR